MDEGSSLARYDYLALVLEDDFLPYYLDCSASGILPYELLNLCSECGHLLDEFDYEGNEDSRLLRYAVVTAIDDYLKEGVGDGV